MKFVLALLIIGLAWLAVVARSQSVALRQQQDELKALSAKLDAPAQPTVSLELQGQCAKRAHEEYKLEGFEHDQWASFSSHYSPKMGKCFVEVENTDTKTIPGTTIIGKKVVDAFEGRVFASYTWSTDKKKKYWEVAPLECTVKLLNGEDKKCTSADGPDGFNELVKLYMQ
jgi:hypothetical protein